MDAQTLPPEDWARSLAERQLAVLDQLAEAGLQIALAVRDQATGNADAPTVVQGDVSLAFARVSRAVRMTLALQSKIVADLQAVEVAAAEERFQEAQFRKGQVEAAVERVIRAEHEGDSEEAVEALLDKLIVETGERLDDEDVYGDVMTRPIQDMVAQVCRDLGVGVDWMETPPNAASPARGGGGPLKGVEGAYRRKVGSTAQLNGGGLGPPSPPLRGPPLPRAGEAASP